MSVQLILRFVDRSAQILLAAIPVDAKRVISSKTMENVKVKNTLPPSLLFSLSPPFPLSSLPSPLLLSSPPSPMIFVDRSAEIIQAVIAVDVVRLYTQYKTRLKTRKVPASNVWVLHSFTACSRPNSLGNTDHLPHSSDLGNQDYFASKNNPYPLKILAKLQF